MKNNIAILQVADTGPLESLVVMLSHAGYVCGLPNDKLRNELRSLGCDTVLDIQSLVDGMGYDPPMPLPTVGPEAMKTADLYVDVKGHRNGPKIWERYPNLKDRTLWYRINGGKPEHVVRQCDECRKKQETATKFKLRCPKCEDCGDEANPPCPILTPNLWYDQPCGHGRIIPDCLICSGRAYAFWPPFYRFNDYHRTKYKEGWDYDRPICLIHNLTGWGYQRMIPEVSELGVRCFGRGSPDGLIQHSEVKNCLKTALCMVHLKSSDAPGYALYEALAAGCPIICSRRLIWRNRMQDLFVPNETCLVFDRETHDGLSDKDVADCRAEIEQGIKRLNDPTENARIGFNGRKRLQELMWNSERDGESLKTFMTRNFK